MSKERELLNRSRYNLDREYCADLIDEIQELLAQPEQEQEPVAWIDAGSLKSLQESTGYSLCYLTSDAENLKNTDVPLYLAPPKSEIRRVNEN